MRLLPGRVTPTHQHRPIYFLLLPTFTLPIPILNLLTPPNLIIQRHTPRLLRSNLLSQLLNLLLQTLYLQLLVAPGGKVELRFA